MKTINHWRKKLKTTEDGKISHTHGLAESMFWKWLYYQKQSTCSIGFPKDSNDIHHRDWNINPKVHLEAQKTVIKKSNNESIILPNFKL
jgi:hypothetical protein